METVFASRQGAPRGWRGPDGGVWVVDGPEMYRIAGGRRQTIPRTGVLSGNAVDLLKSSVASEVVVTDTLPIPADRHFDKLTVLSIAPLISRAIREVFEDGSVTSLFDGKA